jgi:phospholipid/cholesterol/gamma-HCH transport system ATP-binding protein
MIEVKDLKKQFGPSPVLKGVSFSIEKGESITIIGTSGGGKSVLLKHLVGLLTPDSGMVRIDGLNIEGLDERQMLPVRRKFGMLFQGAALFDSMTVEENVAFVLNRERKMTPAQIACRVEEALDLVGLEGIQKKKPAELSGGMRKRVGLARAVIYHPEIVLYDEPTTGLDPIASDTIDLLIMRVVEKLKVTSIVVTHDMRSARRVGKRILLLHQGQIYADKTPEEIFASKDPVIYRFVNGISEIKKDEEL